MGRHSAARHTHSARFVGRVGSLALALGIGAAVAGGAGIANAEGGDDGHASASAPKTESSGATGGTDTKTPKPAGTKTKPAPPSLSGVIAGISKQLAAAVHPVGPAKPSSSTGASKDPVSKDAGSKDSVTKDAASKSTRSKPRIQTPSDDAPASEQSATPFTRKLANEAAAAIRGDAKPLRSVVNPTADVTPPKQDPAPVTTTVFNLAASTPVAPAKPRQALANPIATVVSGFLSAVGLSPTASSTGGAPTAPMPLVMGVLQLIRREVDHLTLALSSPSPQFTSLVNPTKAVSALPPTPGDATITDYGKIGNWMLTSDKRISDYGGQPYGGKTLLEPVNVIIVDPTSTSSAQATGKLNSAMFWSGFPAQPIHSTGFKGTIDDITYGQQPQGLIDGYSDNFFIFPNDHGRVFGPDPTATDKGYVWSGAFSTEQFTIYNFLPAHSYVSSNMARDALAMRLIMSGQATYGGMVKMNNAYDTTGVTTGDHDGYAVVLVLK